MVYLSRIYTRTGDQGETALGDGTRVPKDHPRVAAYGAVDELNASLGVLTTHAPAKEPPWNAMLAGIQNDLFDVGADLCLPKSADEGAGERLRVSASQVEKLERVIDRVNESLSPLRSFVLPGGSDLSAWGHLARTVCRRAERDVVALMRTESINPNVLIYLNRLSDLLFVLARAWNANGQADVLWVPGQGGQ